MHFHRFTLRDRVFKSRVTPGWRGSTSVRNVTTNAARFHIRPRTRQLCEPPSAWTHLPRRGQTCRGCTSAAGDLGPPPRSGCFSTTYVNYAWQHKLQGRRRRAQFLTQMAALEVPLSGVAHWAWNHQLFGRGLTEDALEQFYYVEHFLWWQANVSRISPSNNNCQGRRVACKSR